MSHQAGDLELGEPVLEPGHRPRPDQDDVGDLLVAQVQVRVGAGPDVRSGAAGQIIAMTVGAADPVGIFTELVFERVGAANKQNGHCGNHGDEPDHSSVAAAMAASTAVALATHSSYSAAGSLSATIPAPA